MTSSSRTYYPDRLRNIGQEHATRMPAVASCNVNGFEPFNVMDRTHGPEEKIHGIKALNTVLQSVAANVSDPKKQNDIYWQFCLAAQTRFLGVAMYDTMIVSSRMRGHLKLLFSLTGQTEDEGIIKKQNNILDDVIETCFSPSLSHPVSDVVRRRALGLAKQLLNIKPGLANSIWHRKARKTLGLDS